MGAGCEDTGFGGMESGAGTGVAWGFSVVATLFPAIFPDMLRGEAGYAYLLAEDRETGDALLGRPAHSGRASLESAMPFGTRAALSGIYTGTTPVQRNEETVVEREGYLRFDATLSASLPAGLQISGGVRNLLDERPEQWPGFTGRHLFIGIGWRTAGTVDDPSGGERYH